MHQIADTVDISTASVKTIFNEHLFMTKVCARWVLRMLEQKMKDYQCKTANENLKVMQSNWDLFMWHTGDETTMTLQIPNNKACSGTMPVLQALQVQDVKASAGKIMCTVFWDAEGTLLID